MRDRLLISGVVTMTLLLLLLLAGAFPVGQNEQLVIFKTPVFLSCAGLGVLLMLAAGFQRRPLLRQTAFWLTHAGLILVLAGAITGWLAGIRYDGLRLPVEHAHSISKLRNRTGEPTELGFSLAITNFTVSTYDPVYALFRPRVPHPASLADYEFIQDVDPRVSATLTRSPAGSIDPGAFRQDGHWLPEKELENGWLVRKREEIPSGYEAAVQLTLGDTTESHRLAVNQPLSVKGWRVFLVSYGAAPMPFVELTFKRDPGFPMVSGGIGCIILGVALICLAVPSRPGKEDRHATG